MRIIALTVLGTLSACSSTPRGNYPSLAPRAAEAVDPRVPVDTPVRSGPVDPALSAHLAALIDQAQAGDSAFQGVMGDAERLAEAAGKQQSESWVAAQQALSAAQAARAPTTRALGDIDALASNALETKGGIPAGNLAAIQQAAKTVSAIDRNQSDRIDAIERRLGL